MRSELRISALLWLALACTPLEAEVLRLNASAIFDRAVTRNLRLASDGSALELDSGELFEDDGPATGFSYRPNEEKLSDTVWIRKQLVIADPRASAAILLVGRGGDLSVVVNGQAQQLERPRKAGLEWQAYTINPAALKAGVNEIVLHGAGRVWIARGDEFPGPWPHRSARSADGGRSWSSERLGPDGNIPGEYYVRIFLDHYRSQGSITLPVMDVANLAGVPLGPPLSALGPLRIGVRAEAGAHQSVSVQVRSGTTYVPGAKSWSDWTPLGSNGTLAAPHGRYFQLEVKVSTDDPLESPRLSEITVETTPVAAAGWTRTVAVGDAHNEEIIRTSIPFRYEPFSQPRLRELRQRYHLDEVTRGAKTEFDLIARLAAWAARQWTWGEWHLKESYPAWNALEILKKHRDGKPVGGFCLQYNLVFLQACESFGLAGRVVSISQGTLGRPKSGGHEVAEIWSHEYRKWVYVDGYSAWYAVDNATGVPLSLWELRKRQIRALRDEPAEAIRIVQIEKNVHIWGGLTEKPPFAELRLIPRSNFLEQASPVPLSQGMLGWFWPGHYVWTDADVPADLLYGNRVTQYGNFYWTLDQAHYALEPAAAAGEIRVHLDTETPGFDTFLAEIDAAPKHSVTAVFSWKLHPGRNRLKVWPRNDAGREGIASWIELDMPATAGRLK